MVEKNYLDDLDVGDVPTKKGGKLNNFGAGKTIAIGMGFLLVIGVIFTLVLGGGNSKTEAVKNLPLTEANAEITQTKSFAAQFLDKFYWYNRDSFLDIRTELEKMMTTSFLEKYKRVYYDSDFEQEVIDSNLIMSPTYDAILYKKDTAGSFVRILGDIKYTNGRTGAERTRVSTWTLKIVNEDGQYKVDDFIIELGE
jgi:hypothetical protein